MTVYEHRTSLITSAGSTSTTSLNILGGLCRQVLITAATSTTVFRAYITDSQGLVKRNYGMCTGELNDVTFLPMSGYHKVNILNASPDDTFKIYIGIEE
jgi:hypothetical protein